MKKFISIVIIALLILGSIITVSAATSPVKDYASAKDGDLLYTFNFNGDSVFTPQKSKNSADNMTYTASSDGSSLTIKGKAGGSDKTQNFWGGAVKGLEATLDTAYSLVYEIKANGNVGKYNRVGVGGWIVDFDKDLVYNSYGAHNTVDSKGSKEYQEMDLLYGINKIFEPNTFHEPAQSTNIGEYKYNVSNDGFITMMIVYDGDSASLCNYVLAEGATDITQKSSWLLIEENTMYDVLSAGSVNNKFGFWTYAYYLDTDTTIRNARIYKSAFWGITPSPDSSGAVTTAPGSSSQENNTDTPVSNTQQDKKTEELSSENHGVTSGCLSTVTGTGAVLALITCFGAVSLNKKKKR